MKQSAAELKAKVLADVEARLDRLFEELEGNARPTLAEIEDVVLRFRAQVGRTTVTAVVNAQDSVQLGPGPKCPACGKEMRVKGRKHKDIQTRLGDVGAERCYYYCPRCKRGFFPLDDQLQLWDAHYSETLAKEAVWLMGLMPDDLVERVFQHIGGLTLSDSSIWRRTKRWGEMIKVVADAEVAAAHALPKRETVIRGEARSEPAKGVGIDGVIINIRDEGYKELKVGCVFDVERPQPQADGEEGFARAANISYVGHLGGPKAFGNVIWAEACRRKWSRALDTIALGDGAPWIWNVVQEHFGTSLQAVDYYHAMEHVYHISHLVYGQGTPKAKQHGKRMENLLYQGHARSVANHAEVLAERCTAEVSKALKTEAGYFRHYAERMQYMELREAGWPIGSGTVESGGKQFRGRFSGPGMRWSRDGAERMIPIRAAIMSRRYDDVWSRTYKLAPKLN